MPPRISLLVVSVCCVVMVLALAAYVYHNRRIKVFKVASPIFLAITLLGCAMMYLEVGYGTGSLPTNLRDFDKTTYVRRKTP